MRKYNTLFVGNVVHHFDRLASTNEHAFSLLAKTKPSEGTVISTHAQTAGRGQIGRQWWVTPGKSLTFSLILYPHRLAAQQQFLLSQAVSLAVAASVRTWLPTATVQVKWPNDIYVDQHKVAGILIQNSLQGSQIKAAVVGVGLNVNESRFPAALPQATSLAIALGQDLDLEAVRADLFEQLEKQYLLLRGGAYTTIQQRYLDQLLDYERERTFRRPDGTPFSGRITGIDPSGRLMVAVGATTEYFALGEIRHTFV